MPTRAGGTLRRRVDVATGAKSPFIASGIPGSVGSSAIALWQELRGLGEHPRLAVWPFHGTLAELTGERRLILAETYPRACYAIALQPGDASMRRVTPLAKTKPQVRAEAVRRIRQVERTRSPALTVHDWDAVAASEDDFDACVTGLALLRATLDQSLFRVTALEDPRVEGGILGVSAVNVEWPRAAGVAPGTP